MGPDERRLLEIPLAKVRSMAAHPVTKTNREKARALGSGNQLARPIVPCTTTFQYEGVFAEHLARVTESTLRSQWKKDLPVIQH